jgi:hypothetical protein
MGLTTIGFVLTHLLVMASYSPDHFNNAAQNEGMFSDIKSEISVQARILLEEHCCSQSMTLLLFRIILTSFDFAIQSRSTLLIL